MSTTSGAKRLLTLPAPNAPACPRCQTSMVPTVRPARLAPVKSAARASGAPLQLAVWLCETCGIKRPRFS